MKSPLSNCFGCRFSGMVFCLWAWMILFVGYRGVSIRPLNGLFGCWMSGVCIHLYNKASEYGDVLRYIKGLTLFFFEACFCYIISLSDQIGFQNLASFWIIYVFALLDTFGFNAFQVEYAILGYFNTVYFSCTSLPYVVTIKHYQKTGIFW